MLRKKVGCSKDGDSRLPARKTSQEGDGRTRDSSQPQSQVPATSIDQACLTDLSGVTINYRIAGAEDRSTCREGKENESSETLFAITITTARFV